ncbi:hypothetical protein K439DRAFT_1625100 [Ramaria rubella]|nr:hypothetical protein K439DRAFT_1625100 [Ramaria rubella]
MFCNVYYQGNVSDKGSLSTTRPPFRLVSHLGLELGVQIVLFTLFVVYVQYISSPNAFTTTCRVRKAQEQFRWHIAMAGRPRGRPPKKYTPRGQLAAKLCRSITELFSHSSPEPPSEGEATAPNPPSHLEDGVRLLNPDESQFVNLASQHFGHPLSAFASSYTEAPLFLDTIRRNKPEWKNLGCVNTVDIPHWFDAQHNDFNSWKAHVRSDCVTV